MSFVIPHLGNGIVADAITGKTFQNLTLRLFVNNQTPAKSDTKANYTEATGGGYAAKALTSGTWTTNTAITDDYSVSAYPQQTWTFTGALTTHPAIYGYYITRASDTEVVLAERFDAPFTPTANGDFVAITLVYLTASL